MRQISLGGWKLERRRSGGARFILQAATGEQVYADLEPEDLVEMRARLDGIEAQPQAEARAEAEATLAAVAEPAPETKSPRSTRRPNPTPAEGGDPDPAA